MISVRSLKQSFRQWKVIQHLCTEVTDEVKARI
jgi:hypothetical protein